MDMPRQPGNPFHSDRIDELHHAYADESLDTSLPVPAKRIRDYCEARDRALDLLRASVQRWREYQEAVRKANAAIKLAAPSQQRHFGDLELGELANRSKEFNEAFKATGRDQRDSIHEICRRRVDAAGWEHLLTSSTLADLMDATAKKEFRAGLEDPVPLTEHNCFATMRTVLDQASDMQCRGVVELFSKLNFKDYKSNDCFSIGKRIVIENAVEASWSGDHYRFCYGAARDALIDLERAICLITGDPVPTHEATIVRVLEAGPFQANHDVSAETLGRDTKVWENGVWKIRWFRKGTVHAYIKPAKVRARLNQMIASHFGANLGDGSDRPNAHNPTFTGKVKERSTGIAKVDRNAYYSPPRAAEIVAREAGIADYCEANGGCSVLEPSCGHGELMMAAYRAGCRMMHGVENHIASANAAMERLRAEFDRDGVAVSDWRDDRLKVYRSSFDVWEPNTWQRDGYTHVLMNPPFDHQLRHVTKAYKHLRPGHVTRRDNVLVQGCLVAIMGANVLTNQQEDYRTFRAWLKAKGAVVAHMPKHSFRPSGTDVDTILVKIPAPMSS